MSAWILLGLGVILALLGVGDILVGAGFDAESAPALTGLTLDEIAGESPAATVLLDARARAGGTSLVALGVLLAIVARIPYRQGQRWAWVAMWILPAWALAITFLPLGAGLAPGQSPTASSISGMVIAGIAAAVLVIDRRLFTGR